MSLTKEMMMSVENDIKSYNNEDLLNYYTSYKALNTAYPNSFYYYRASKSLEEIYRRGIENEIKETKTLYR